MSLTVSQPQVRTVAMTKNEALHWLDELSHTVPQALITLSPISYFHTGTAYGEDTLRFTAGSLEKLAAMIAPFAKALLAHETAVTRLGLTVQPVKDRDSGKATGAWSAHITAHKRAPSKVRMALR